MDSRSPSSPVEPIEPIDFASNLTVRRYLHFDAPLARSTLAKLVADPRRVATWSFLPLLQTIIRTPRIKREGKCLVKAPKDRPISYASHKDAALYEYYARLISEPYEGMLRSQGLTENVTAFRRLGKSNVDLANEAFSWIQAHCPCVALAYDVKGFFPSLDHSTLKAAWMRLLRVQRLPSDHFAVFKSITRAATVDLEEALHVLGISPYNQRKDGRQRLCTAEAFRSRIREAGLIKVCTDSRGIPQGTPISALLSNVYMLAVDARVAAYAQRVGGLYRRYCDDILLVVPPENAGDAEKLVERELEAVCLTLQPEKTLKCTFDQPKEKSDRPLQYLGLVFHGDRTLLRSTGIARYYAKMRSGVRLAKNTRLKAEREAGLPPGSTPLRSKKLNRLYSHVGKRNFVSYALKASEVAGDGAIRRQVRRHWQKLQREKSKEPED
jgi:RNA-directed DNA polymerase